MRYWSPNPNKANVLKNSRDFQASGNRFSAEGRNALAKAHTAGRNARMLELLMGVSALASHARSANAAEGLRQVPGSSASCTRAILRRQWYRAPDQAAHFLPGQLRLDARPVWDYVPNSVGRLYLMDLFADVERLHANFNRADSAAENGPVGLKALAAHCAHLIVRDASVPKGGVANRQLVWNVYRGLWLPGLEHSFTAAIENKLTKPRPPEIEYKTPTFSPSDPSSSDPRLIANLQQRSDAGDSAWNINETVAILRDSKANATSGPGPADVSDKAQRAEAGIRGHAMVLEAD